MAQSRRLHDDFSPWSFFWRDPEGEPRESSRIHSFPRGGHPGLGLSLELFEPILLDLRKSGADIAAHKPALGRYILADLYQKYRAFGAVNLSRRPSLRCDSRRGSGDFDQPHPRCPSHRRDALSGNAVDRHRLHSVSRFAAVRLLGIASLLPADANSVAHLLSRTIPVSRGMESHLPSGGTLQGAAPWRDADRHDLGRQRLFGLCFRDRRRLAISAPGRQDSLLATLPCTWPPVPAHTA